MFPEQTPYLEWKNSSYKDDGVQCQSCHMPVTNTPVDISILPAFHTTLRTPYWKHLFVGGNKKVNRLLSNNVQQLQLSASVQNFDTTLYYTEKLLTNNSIKLSISPEIKGQNIEVNVSIENLAGHKIPTGIPYRRIWIHLKVEDENQNIIFESGKWDLNGEIIGLDSLYEPHYDVIAEENQVQIYETILKDVNGDITHNLLRTAAYEKDNRLPPIGFTTTHISYDTIAIVGSASTDSNFNKDGTEEGTGKDKILFVIPINSNGLFNVLAEVCYQSFSPRLINYLQGINNPDIQQFVSLFNSSDKEPAILSSDSAKIVISSIGNSSNEIKFYLNQNYPNPFNPTTTIKFGLPKDGMVTLEVYNLIGEKVAALINQELTAGYHTIDFNGNRLSSGIYLYKITAGEFTSTKKFVLMK
jgi:hypothetical protein